ncbi:oxidoreductase [Aestuariivirga litoralis]|uniref:Oxidoreductase n=1 Tax=Aestuariivirga litoralis TaxID=2650924 RepID=A0A2W2AIN9_9HYPH|nr:FAD-dependent oxidoreductase [Aestuariivirga litoralis]PZF75141.1 oxidoreductase [Aestuariivirga litoralis]
MSNQFPALFQPLQLRHKTLRNRIVFGSHTANMSVDGLPGERHRGYYEERARGGVGMIVVEPVPVHRTAVLTRGNFRHSTDEVIPHFRKITDAVHAHGAVICNQLYHVGQHGDFDNSYQPSWSPSGLPSFHDSDGSHAMTEAEIEEIIESFVQAARRAKEAGFDGIELFAAYNAIIDQFWLPFNNRRDDRWGGSFENRMRFSRTIMERIRKMAGEDFIIGLAVNMDPTSKVSQTIEQLQEVIAWHDERQLMDYVTCGTGSYFNFTGIIPHVFYADKLGAPHAEALRQVVKHARVQCESHVRTPENANYVVASGQADMVSIVRGQIADPHLANKAKEGRPEDVRPCLSCNQMCWGRRYRDYWISCLINPSAGREFEWGGDRFTPAAKPKKVLVVGGGVAGLEAARVAAERGHQVTLAEASDKLGGQFRLAGLTPRRHQIIDYLDWFERQLAKLQVKVLLNTPLDAEEAKAFGADEIIVATGSMPDGKAFQRAMPEHDQLPGIERGNVASAEDVMARIARPGKRVLVLDETANWKGGGVALTLAEAGHQVTVVTPAAAVMAEMARTAADIELRARLRELGVTLRTDSVVREWHGDGATIQSFGGAPERIAADTLVVASTNVAEHELGDTLGAPMIGDAVAARNAAMAIYEGRKLAMSL